MSADKQTHTPGPWWSDEVTSGVDKVWATDAKGDFPICDIRGWGHLIGKGHGALGLPPETAVAIQKANARLIAAAPEMLAALNLARIVLKNRDRGETEDRVYHQILYVIGKAEGLFAESASANK